MTDPFKLRALKSLTDALKTISTGDGYHFTMADFVDTDGVTVPRVYRGREWFGESDPIPMISILEGVDPAAEVGEPPVTTAAGAFTWQILIQGWVTDDPLNPTDHAYRLLADVRRRLAVEAQRRHPTDRFPDPFGLGNGKNRVEQLHIGSGVVRPAGDTSSTAWFWLTLGLDVVDNAADPYG